MSRLVLVVALAACSPEVIVGADGAPAATSECQEVTSPQAACPEAPWGARLSFDSAVSLEQKLVGRWAFCGGELRYSGRGPLKGFAQGSGIEFWSDAGQLHYAFLRGTRVSLSRRQDAASSGTARLITENGRGRAVLVSGDGQEVVWNADFFNDQRVLQNGAFDVWNFVAVD